MSLPCSFVNMYSLSSSPRSFASRSFSVYRQAMSPAISLSTATVLDRPLLVLPSTMPLPGTELRDREIFMVAQS